MKGRSLRDLFHLVKQVVPEEQELVTFEPEKSVGEALTAMLERNLSQVPVVEGEEVLGVFSFRSFASGVQRLPVKEKEILDLPVEEFLEDLRFAHISDELPDLLDEFDIKDAVLVGAQERLQGIVTTFDALRYFYNVASPYVILREIELSIRELIRASVDQEQLVSCIEKSLGKHYRDQNRDIPKVLEELTFNDYVTLVRFGGTWNLFRPAFGGTTNTTYTRLRDLPDLRNAVFHFKRDLTAGEYDTLRDCRDYLLRRIRKVEASRGRAEDV
jgi:CBS domain-containing protein